MAQSVFTSILCSTPEDFKGTLFSSKCGAGKCFKLKPPVYFEELNPLKDRLYCLYSLNQRIINVPLLQENKHSCS